MDYKSAGVDRDRAAQAISSIQSEIEKTYRPEILSRIGGFASAFEIPKSYKEPVILSSTDGVGTKLLLAEKEGTAEALQSVGQDLVAMSVNDLLAARGEPIAFLDYLATGGIEKDRYENVILGVAKACQASNCSLIGGETAEMPGFYPQGRMDLAGFAMGVCEKSELWDFSQIGEGDVLVAWPSSGFHSNGFSLVRKIMESKSWTLDSVIEGDRLGDFLLQPTRLYVSSCLKWLRDKEAKAAIHITGGGLFENLPRVLTAGSHLGFQIFSQSLPEAPMMKAFCEAGKVDAKEAYSTFNMGIGFVALTAPALADRILKEDSTAFELGRVSSGIAPVVIEGL